MRRKAIRRLTYFIAGLAATTVTATASLIIMDQNGDVSLFSDAVRDYTYEFYNEGTLFESGTLKRGEPLTVPTPPGRNNGEKGTAYIPLGWSSTGLSIPNLFAGSETRLYSNIVANAVYVPFGYEDIDLETLLDVLSELGIDPQDFLDWAGIDLDDVSELYEMVDFKFTGGPISVPLYFRSESYGDLGLGKFKWSSAPYFNPSICSNGTSPLSFASDKITQRYDAKDISIEFLEEGSVYPAPMYEVGCETYENLKSDSHTLMPSNLTNMTYTSKSVYPYDYMGFKWYSDELAPEVQTLVNLEFTDDKIKQDELSYRQFVKKNYLNIPSSYKDYMMNFAEENGIGSYDVEGYHLLDKVRKAVKSICEFNWVGYDLGGIGDDPIKKFMEESECGIGIHFNTVATLLFRRLGLPARLVGGYRYIPFGLSEDAIRSNATNFIYGGENEVSRLLSHNWTEVYIDGLGWIEVDCSPFLAVMESYYDDVSQFFSKSMKDGDILTEIPQAGPGSGTPDGDPIFTYKSSYQGTTFFRSCSYADYENNEWSNNSITQLTIEQLMGTSQFKTYNPLTFTAEAAQDVFVPNQFEITYCKDTVYPAAPMYSINSYKSAIDWVLDDSITMSKDETPVTRTYSGYNFDLTEQNLQMIINQNYKSASDLKLIDTAYNSTIARSQYRDVGKYATALSSMLSQIGVAGLTDAQKVVKIKDFVQSNFAFTTDYETPSVWEKLENGDPDTFSYFINSSHQGDSMLFATLTTMLFRQAGYGARFVTGFGANSNGTDKNNMVTKDTVHCMCEVYIPKAGWILVDSTGFLENGQGNNDGNGNGLEPNPNRTIYPEDVSYGDGFGGGGVNETCNTIVLQFENYDPLNYTFTKTYDGNGFAKADIKLKSGLTLWPGDRFVPYMQEDITSFYKNGSYYSNFYFLIVNDDTDTISYDSRDPSANGNGESKRYIDPYYEEFGDMIFYEFKVDKRPLTLTAPTLKISEYDWATQYDGNPIDMNTKPFKTITISNGSLANGDSLAYVLEGSLTGAGTTSVTIKSYTIVNYRGEDVTDCYKVTKINGVLSIKD